MINILTHSLQTFMAKALPMCLLNVKGNCLLRKIKAYTTYTSNQKTRHQKLNSYWVMNSLGDKICPPAAPSTPVNKIE